MAGYSGKPLHAKLGLKHGQRVAVIADGDLPTYQKLLGQDAPEISISDRVAPDIDVIHVFTASRAHLEAFLPDAMAQMARDGMI